MAPLIKPRGFWDYALFALIMSSILLFLFWMEASDGIAWPDVVLALAATVLFVFCVILARGREKATWIKHPSWGAHLFANLGAILLVIGTIYADAHLLHRGNTISNRLLHDIGIAVLATVGTIWWSRKRSLAKRPLS